MRRYRKLSIQVEIDDFWYPRARSSCCYRILNDKTKKGATRQKVYSIPSKNTTTKATNKTGRTSALKDSVANVRMGGGEFKSFLLNVWDDAKKRLQKPRVGCRPERSCGCRERKCSLACGYRGRCNLPRSTVAEPSAPAPGPTNGAPVSVAASGEPATVASPGPPLSSAVANALALFSAAMNRPATTGGSGGGAEIASPLVAPEAGEPEVAEISGSDSDGIEEKESDERHDSDSDRRSEASSPGSSTLSWGDGYGGESDDSDLMGGAWSLKGSCAAAAGSACPTGWQDEAVNNLLLTWAVTKHHELPRSGRGGFPTVPPPESTP
ncbi:unnamed protein product [Pylaiella littoralis]